jgi:DNA-binding NarL/FixJ family response regulator
MEKELQDCNQFGRVYSCEGLRTATDLVHNEDIKVLLIDRGVAENAPHWDEFKDSHPQMGFVLVSDSDQALGSQILIQLGVHAQTSRSASPVDWITSIAKAMVNRLKPQSFKRWLKD